VAVKWIRNQGIFSANRFSELFLDDFHFL
jgi:hypothetical protein